MSETLSEVVLTFEKFLKTQSIKRGPCDQNVNACLLLHLRYVVQCCRRRQVLRWHNQSCIPELGRRNSWAGKQSNNAVIAMASNQSPSNFTQAREKGREGGVRWFWLSLHKKLLARARSFDQVSKCNSQFPGHHLWITLWMCNPLSQIARPCIIYHSREAFVKIADHIVPFVSSVWAVSQ